MSRMLGCLAMIAALGLAGCSSAPKASFDDSASGLTDDQRTIRESANDRTPAEVKNEDFSWMKHNALILLAGVGCAAGAAIGGSAGDCLTGAAIGGLAGAVASVTVFEDRQSYASDADYVKAVSDELARIEVQNKQVAAAGDRLATQYEARVDELNYLYDKGEITAGDYRTEYVVMHTDEEALRYIVLSNKDISTKIDKALTGVTVPTSDQARVEEQETTFLGDSSAIEYALERISGALAKVPTAISKE